LDKGRFLKGEGWPRGKQAMDGGVAGGRGMEGARGGWYRKDGWEGVAGGRGKRR